MRAGCAVGSQAEATPCTSFALQDVDALLSPSHPASLAECGNLCPAHGGHLVVALVDLSIRDLRPRLLRAGALAGAARVNGRFRCSMCRCWAITRSPSFSCSLRSSRSGRTRCCSSARRSWRSRRCHSPAAHRAAPRLRRPRDATLLAAVAPALPATALWRVHEFHPEAFAAPLSPAHDRSAAGQSGGDRSGCGSSPCWPARKTSRCCSSDSAACICSSRWSEGGAGSCSGMSRHSECARLARSFMDVC